MKNTFDINKLLSISFNSKEMKPDRIRKIRKLYNATQVVFAELIMINYETYRSWEQGKRIPSSPGYAILSIAEQYPDIFLKHRDKIISRIQNRDF